MPTRLLIALLLLLASQAAAAQELPDEGQSEAAFRTYLIKKPAFRVEVASLEKWLKAKSVAGVLPTWQVLRTASMWKVCNGPPFEVPPRKLWGNLAATLRFVRDHVRPALGGLQAVSAYRNPTLNVCARGSANSAHRDFSALDLVPDKPLTRRQISNQVCRVHARKGPANGAGLGFYAFARFHIDTRSFRRWGSAGPLGNESPCAVLERGEDPEAPPLPPVPAPAPATAPQVPPAPATAPQVPPMAAPQP
jgi:hypothetical protein